MTALPCHTFDGMQPCQQHIHVALNIGTSGTTQASEVHRLQMIVCVQQLTQHMFLCSSLIYGCGQGDTMYADENLHTTTQLCLQMKQLRCFMYVSTAYANAHLGSGPQLFVKEQLYPIRDEDGQPLNHAALANHLMSLPPAQAQQEVRLSKALC